MKTQLDAYIWPPSSNLTALPKEQRNIKRRDLLQQGMIRTMLNTPCISMLKDVQIGHHTERVWL